MIEEIVTFEEETQEIITFDESDDEILTLEEGSSSGTNNYELLNNKPKINDVTLIGNKTSSELKLQGEMSPLSNMDIRNLLGGD